MGRIVDTPSARRQGPLVGLYGAPGTGKTTILAGLARALRDATGKPLLVADWEGGTTALAPFRDALKGSLLIWEPDPVASPVDEAWNLIDEAKEAGVGALAIDTVTTWLDNVLRWLTTQNLTTSGRATARPGIKTTRGISVRHPTMQDYGMAGNIYADWTAYALRLRDAGAPILLVAHEKLLSTEDELGTAIEVKGGPELVGQSLVRSAPKLMQLILRLGLKRRPGKPPARVVRTAEDGVWMAKDRLRLWPPVVDITAKTTEEQLEKSAAFWTPFVEHLVTGDDGERKQEKPRQRRRRRRG